MSAACPRCHGPVAEAQWTVGGGYREAPATFVYLRCEPCAISILRGDAISERYDRDGGRLGGSAIEPDRRTGSQSCPECLANFDRLTLAWGDLWVELEECSSCGAVVLDDGEGRLLDEPLVAFGRR